MIAAISDGLKKELGDIRYRYDHLTLLYAAAVLGDLPVFYAVSARSGRMRLPEWIVYMKERRVVFSDGRYGDNFGRDASMCTREIYEILSGRGA